MKLLLSLEFSQYNNIMWRIEKRKIEKDRTTVCIQILQLCTILQS